MGPDGEITAGDSPTAKKIKKFLDAVPKAKREFTLFNTKAIAHAVNCSPSLVRTLQGVALLAEYVTTDERGYFRWGHPLAIEKFREHIQQT